MASVLVAIAGHFQSPLSLAKSVKLSFLPNISLMNTKRQVA